MFIFIINIILHNIKIYLYKYTIIVININKFIMSNESPPQSNVNNTQSSSSLSSSLSQFWVNIQQEASSLNFNNISSPKQLLSLINTLRTDVNQSLLSWIHTLIQKYPFVIPMLEDTSTSFTQVLVELYFKNILNDSLIELIQNIMKFITQNYDVPVTTYKYLYRQLAVHYQFYTHKPQNDDNMLMISKEIYLKHLELLEILYQTNSSNNTNKGNNNSNDELIKNYFYFTNPQQILIKKYEFNSQFNPTNKLPDVNYGFVIAMKLYIDNYTDINNNNNNTRQPAVLTQIEYFNKEESQASNHNILEIKLTYNPCQIYICEYKKDILGPIDVPTNTWIELKLKIEPNSSNNKTDLIFELIQQTKQSRLVTNQNTTINSYKNINTITPITILRNFTGKISSFLIYSIPQNNNDKIERSLLSLVTNDYTIKPNQIITNLLYEHDTLHQQVQTHSKSKNKAQPTSLYTDLSAYIIVYYLPQYISYSNNRSKLYLEDFSCNYQGILVDESESCRANGVLVCNDRTTNADELGGVNSLLPLSEIIIKYKDTLLNEDSTVFVKYLMFIFKIWLKSSYNVYAIHRENIFVALGLFMESLQLKHQINDTSILALLFEILRVEEISVTDYIQPLLKMVLNKHFLCKFQIDCQRNIISGVASLLDSNDNKDNNKKSNDNNKNKNQLNEAFIKLLPELFELIRAYDVNKYTLYCCNEHKQLFKHNKNINYTAQVKQSPIKESITNVGTLIKSIIVHADNLNMNDIQPLIDFMCVDLSPCAQNELISIIEALFELTIKNDKDDSTTSNINNSVNEIINNLIENKTLVSVLLFRFSKGLIDTKAKIIKALRNIIYRKLREKYMKGNKKVRDQCSKEMESILMYMEMSIISGGVFINKNYLNEHDIYKQTVFGIDAKRKRKCSYNKTRTSIHTNIDINSEYNVRKRKYSDNELNNFSSEQYTNMLYPRNSSCNSQNNNSMGNSGNKNVIANNEFKEGEKEILNANPNEDNNGIPDLVINSTNEDDTQKQRTTTQSPDITRNTVLSGQAEINRDSANNRNSSISGKQKQKSTPNNAGPKKPTFQYEELPKGTLPLFYFTNTKEYNVVYTQLYDEYISWIKDDNFKDFTTQFDYDVFNKLLSIITKTVVNSHSIELISKWCSCLQEKYITSYVRECIYSNIHLFLFETLLHCTLIQKHNYTSLLTTYSLLSPSKFKSTISNLITTTKSLLSDSLFNARAATIRVNSDQKQALLSHMKKDMIKHCIYYQSEFPQQLQHILDELLMDVFSAALPKIEDTAPFIYISKVIYFCMTSSNSNTIPNIISNPYQVLNKLVYVNNTKTWRHYDLALQLINKIFEHINSISQNKMGTKMYNQLNTFINTLNTQTNATPKDIETFAKSILSLKGNKLYDDNKQLTSLFKLFACLLCIVIVYTIENGIALPAEILKHYQNLLLNIIIYTAHRYEEQEKFSKILITCYLVLIHLTDMNRDFNVVFDNINALLSQISKISYPPKKGFFKFPLGNKDSLTDKNPLSKFFIFFTDNMNDKGVFNDYVVANKNKFIAQIHNKVIGNEDLSSYIHDNLAKSVFKRTKTENVTHRHGKVFYYYKGIANKKMPFYYKDKYIKYKFEVNDCIVDRIGEVSKIEANKKKERIVNMNNLRNMYKKKKQLLFSWNSSWSDREVFYNESHRDKLKFKILGHITCDFMRPLVTPILDIDYYLPNFTNFNLKELFENKNNEQSEIYSVNLHVRNIFPINSKSNNNKLFTLINDNEITFTRLFNMHKKNLLWQSEIKKKKEVTPPSSAVYATTISPKTKEPPSIDLLADYGDDDMFKVSRAFQMKKVIQHYETYCCIVKHSYHTPGKIILDRELTFEPISKKNKEIKSFIGNPMNYDSDRKTCFGSIFTSSKKDNDYTSFKLSFTDIKLIFKRNYFYQGNSLEFYTYNNKSIFIKFSTMTERNSFLDKITNNIKLEHPNDIICQEIKIFEREKDPYALDANDIIGYYLSNPYHSHSTTFVTSSNDLQRKWSRYDMSTFAFIMWTNLLGNRSYSDISQYPVFPWVIQDYLNEKNPLPSECLRNLKLPIGMLIPPNNKERATQRVNSFIEIYNIMINELRQEFEMEIEEENEFNKDEQNQTNQTPMTEEMKKLTKDEEVFKYINKHRDKIDFESIPYYFGSHYSNALYINHYLMRLFPYASALIELQGNKFDDPQRLFHNLHLTFTSATGQKSDVRELCPEFFYFNQMFMNINNFNFGKAIDITTSNEDAQYTIGNVQLPKWAEDNISVFVQTQRTILEETSTKDIHEWVDLIFGSKQTGPKARKHKNLYIPYTYEGIVNLNKITDRKKLQMHLRLAEMGLTPIKVYYSEVKERGKPPSKVEIFKEEQFKQLSKNITFTLSKYVKGSSNNNTKGNTLIPVYYKYDNDDNSKCLYVVFSDLSRGKIEIAANTLNELCVNAVVCYKSPLTSMAHCLMKLASCHNNTNTYPHAYALYNKGEVLVVGGFWDGSLILLTKENKIEYILNPSYSSTLNLPSYLQPTNTIHIQPSAITFICLNSNNTSAYCGTANGHILFFSIQNKTKWTLKQTLHPHETAVKYISINTNLQILATIGEDNYIFIYTLPSLRITSSLHFAYTTYIPDYVFLSSSPVPCLALYSVTNSEFKVYDINGNYMISLRDDNGNMINPCVYTSNINFKDYLLYITDKAEIIVRSFPFMIHENACSIKAKKITKVRHMCLQKDAKSIIVVGNDLDISLITNYDEVMY